MSGKFSPLRFEGGITTHVAEGVTVVKTCPWYDESIISPIFLHKTLD
jgi:hypothetical protein